MNNPINQFNTVLFLILIIGFGGLRSGAQSLPENSWEVYVNPSEVGFSMDLLARAEKKFDESRGAALMVVYKGKIVLAKGEVEQKFMVHSIRKSFLNALYGIYVDRGIIDITKTIGELGIDDVKPLNQEEKEATIQDLLSARSGIYHPSAYSPQSMEDNLPARNSHKPGSFWYYNNWDFNTLGTIFNQITGKDLFEEFKHQIADRIGMEDFEPGDCYYRLETEKSMHPAYLFRMSARDMARFGLLYLNRGKWQNHQIIPKSWIEKSTRIVTKDLGPSFNNKGSYGLLWWISDSTIEPMYYASGSGGHRISVFPESDMVIVHRTNTYENNSVSEQAYVELVNLILEAKQLHEIKSPKTKEFIVHSQRPEFIDLDQEKLKKLVGKYKHSFLGTFEIKMGNRNLIMESGVGIFDVYPINENTFYPEDIQKPVVFEKTESADKAYTIEVILDDNGNINTVILYYTD